jgi:hypothetical protein
MGFAIYLLGVIGSGFCQVLFSSGASEMEKYLGKLFSPILFSWGCVSLASTSTNDGEGLRWHKRFDDQLVPLNDVFIWLIIDFVIYLLLALVLDYVLGKEDIRSYFRSIFSTPTDQGGEKASGMPLVPTGGDIESRDGDVPMEVLEENQKVNSDTDNTKFAIRLVSLFKTYYAYTFGIVPSPSRDFKAVNGLNLTVKAGELLCLLGPNGGKFMLHLLSKHVADKISLHIFMTFSCSRKNFHHKNTDWNSQAHQWECLPVWRMCK